MFDLFGVGIPKNASKKQVQLQGLVGSEWFPTSQPPVHNLILCQVPWDISEA